MKKVFWALGLLFLCSSFGWAQEETTTIKVSTNDLEMVMSTGENGFLYQTYLGQKLKNWQDLTHLSTNKKQEVYSPLGSENHFETALMIQHNDGNQTTQLKYDSHSVENLDLNVTKTAIVLKDSLYPVTVKLYYETYNKENIIKSWTEIIHQEKKPIFLSQYASSMIYLDAASYYLTEFTGGWGREAQMHTEKLNSGKKVLDSKLGSRSAMYVQPFFQVGIDGQPQENEGQVLVGTLGWTGNFQFSFEVDPGGVLRIISGINPYASRYELKPNEIFKTPDFIFTISDKGTGEASRNFHRWARNYDLKDGNGDRFTLLNNWEATYFGFNEAKLDSLMRDAKSLGVDLFLLDDGWFGNKYPRVNDKAGLGDWDVMKSKLPNGVPHLVQSAKDAGVKFGIWIEPEMISPKSELYEKHPEWALVAPNRQPLLYRHQLVLDLANPQVQDHVFGVVDNLMTQNPDIAFMKWDCNAIIRNVYSPFLKDKQSNLYIDHVKGLYNVFERVSQKYPELDLMLCAGGSGRCDYEALKYFKEFWCSDNTDPTDRLYIQWGFSQIFPAKAMAAHVTSWNKMVSTKYKVDVAMMCKFGFDIDIKKLSDEDVEFCKLAVKNYNDLKPIILDGDQYRLVSPLETDYMSIMYVDENKDSAVLFAYNLHPRYGSKVVPVKLQGLDPDASYKVTEINLMPNTESILEEDDEIYSGDYLMKVGVNAFITKGLNPHTASKVITLEKQ